MTYQGHHPDGSSVQRHSAGATYPYVVVIRSSGAAGVLHPDGTEEVVARTTVGDKADRLLTYERAIDRAVELAEALATEQARRAIRNELWRHAS